jgi:hypothetical protein
MRGYGLAALIFQNQRSVLPDLAPAANCGCRGISGPVPPPLLMSPVNGAN